MINLEKGQKVAYTGPTKFRVGLGWDVTNNGQDFDLDVCAFIMDGMNKLISDNHLVFYNNKTAPNESLVHSGDNLTGNGEGDDESINVDLLKLEPTVQKIMFIVSIHDAVNRRQNFGQVRNAYIRVFNPDTNVEELKFDLTEDYSVATGIKVAAFYLKDGLWKFEAIGQAEKKVLGDYVTEHQR